MLLSSINMMSGSYNVLKRQLGVCEGNNGVERFMGLVPVCKGTLKKDNVVLWWEVGERKKHFKRLSYNMSAL